MADLLKCILLKPTWYKYTFLILQTLYVEIASGKCLAIWKYQGYLWGVTSAFSSHHLQCSYYSSAELKPSNLSFPPPHWMQKKKGCKTAIKSLFPSLLVHLPSLVHLPFTVSNLNFHLIHMKNQSRQTQKGPNLFPNQPATPWRQWLCTRSNHCPGRGTALVQQSTFKPHFG